jgi:hypothetical protein
MNAAHYHLLVNHLPIIGYGIALVLLLATLVRSGDRGIFLASVLVLLIAGGGTLAAQFSGEPAEEVVEHLQNVPKSMIETHEGAAKIATIIASVTTLLVIALSVVFLRQIGRIPVLPLSILLLATAVTCASMAWVGSLGGTIRHSEIRKTACNGLIGTKPTAHVRT